MLQVHGVHGNKMSIIRPVCNASCRAASRACDSFKRMLQMLHVAAVAVVAADDAALKEIASTRFEL